MSVFVADRGPILHDGLYAYVLSCPIRMVRVADGRIICLRSVFVPPRLRAAAMHAHACAIRLNSTRPCLTTNTNIYINTYARRPKPPT